MQICRRYIIGKIVGFFPYIVENRLVQKGRNVCNSSNIISRESQLIL